MNALQPYLIWIKIAGVLAIMATCAAGGGYMVNDHWEAKYNAEKLKLEQEKTTAILTKVAENDALLAKQQANHAQEIKEYESQHTKDTAQIARNRADVAAGGLYLPKSACNPVAGAAQAANAGQGNGADQTTFRLPERIETGLLNLATRADTETSELEARLAMCQKFAKDNGFAP